MTSKARLSLVFWLATMTIVSRSGAAAAQWREPRSETAFFEVGLALSGNQSDAYTRGLERRGYDEGPLGFSVGWLLSAGTMIPTSRRGPDLGVAVRWERLELGEWSRDTREGRELYRWDTRAASLALRVRQRLAGEWLAIYGQLHGGLAYAYRERGLESRTLETVHHGWSVGGVAGLAVNFWKYGGMFFELGYSHARVLEDAAGHPHNDGGTSLVVGVRARLVTRRNASPGAKYRPQY
jgi:hypothetical protein